MTMSDNDLRETLLEDDRRIMDELGEHPGVFTLTGGALRSKMRPFIILHVIMGTLAIALCVFAVVRVAGAESTRQQVLWALVAAGAFIWVGLSKVYFWMQLERRAIVIEIKRAEIRILEALKRRP